MATEPGILTDWPWKHLGNRFKYIVLASWVLDSMYTALKMAKEEKESSSNDDTRIYLIILPLLLWRIIHAQIWTSYARFRTAKARNRIVDKPIEFEQVDREGNWDDNIILNGVIFYLGCKWVPGAAMENSPMPFWRADGVVITILIHMGAVEFLYYWLHRALHYHFLYSRYHSHHHATIVPEPATCNCFSLFLIPIVTVIVTGTALIVAVGKNEMKTTVAIVGYITFIDFMNYLGHCNFELFTVSSVFNIFPFLKYLFYSPWFHSLHHTQFRTNYSLFVPIYDYIYGTMDICTDKLQETKDALLQYKLTSQRKKVNVLIEKAIIEAEKAGVKVISFGLLNQVWLVCDGFSDEDQRNAAAGTFFIPFSLIPPWIENLKNMRKDCVYCNTPAMTVPSEIQNIHSCEDWLPRRAMSTSRVAGIVHALENWDSHEYGSNSSITLEDVEKVWVASLRHGFRCPSLIDQDISQL
ncbi:hypothetical protein MKX01_002888 [Papaver californicum]|nr:hypothetical protein MKX01_002888 [Papaver californicum]